MTIANTARTAVAIAVIWPERSTDTREGYARRCFVRPDVTTGVVSKLDLKIAAVITAIGLGVSGGLAVAGVGTAAAPVGLR